MVAFIDLVHQTIDDITWDSSFRPPPHLLYKKLRETKECLRQIRTQFEIKVLKRPVWAVIDEYFSSQLVFPSDHSFFRKSTISNVTREDAHPLRDGQKTGPTWVWGRVHVLYGRTNESWNCYHVPCGWPKRTTFTHIWYRGRSRQQSGRTGIRAKEERVQGTVREGRTNTKKVRDV